MVDTERQVGRRDGSDSPVRLGAEGLLLVVGRRDGLDLVSVAVRAWAGLADVYTLLVFEMTFCDSHVGRLGLNGGHLGLRLGGLLELGHLLALDRGSGDLHTQDDISNLARRQRGDVDAVPLSKVAQDQVLEGDFDLHPLVIR